MIHPFTTNKIEQLELDPIKRINGLIWYNTVEKVYKTYIEDKLQIFITDNILFDNIGSNIGEELAKKEFTVSFDSVYSVIVKHNKDSEFFNYTIYDAVEKTTLHTSVEILNTNEIRFDFVEAVTGHLYMYFQQTE